MQSPVTKEETNNNWFDLCELLFFFETYLYHKTLSSSIEGRRRYLCPPFIITHPLSIISIFFLYFSLLDISYYTHKKCGEDCPCSFGAKPSDKSSSESHNPLRRQSESRSSPHSHLYSPETHPKICMIHCMIPVRFTLWACNCWCPSGATIKVWNIWQHCQHWILHGKHWDTNKNPALSSKNLFDR